MLMAVLFWNMTERLGHSRTVIVVTDSVLLLGILKVHVLPVELQLE